MPQTHLYTYVCCLSYDRFGHSPFGIAIAPNGEYAYVPNYLDGTVAVIDTRTNTAVDTIDIGTNPVRMAITPDSRYAYETNYNASTVSVINISSNKVVGSISIAVGNPLGIAITPDGRYAYVTTSLNGTNGAASVIDIATNKVIDTIT